MELVKDASNITPDELTNVFNFGSNGSDDQVMLTGYFAGGANRYHLQFDDATYQATELRGVRIWSKTICRRVRSRSALWMLCVMPDLQPRPLLAAGNS